MTRSLTHFLYVPAGTYGNFMVVESADVAPGTVQIRGEDAETILATVMNIGLPEVPTNDEQRKLVFGDGPDKPPTYDSANPTRDSPHGRD